MTTREVLEEIATGLGFMGFLGSLVVLWVALPA